MYYEKSLTLSRTSILAASMGLILVISSILIFALYHQARAASIVWDGDQGNGLWSDDLNWVGGTAPGASDIAVFNSTYPVDATIDAGFAGSVAGISITSGYTGTITQARTLIIGTSGFVMADGIFAGATQAIDVNGPFTMTGGSFTATSGTMSLSGDTSIGSGTTFTHNSGTIKFDGSTNTNIDVDSTLTLNNLDFDKDSGLRTSTLASGDTIILAGTLTLSEGEFDGGTVQTPGTVTVTAGDGGTGIVNMTGTATQTVSLSDGFATKRFPGLTLDNANVTFDGINHNYFEGAVILNAGTINASGADEWDFEQGLTIAGGTYNAAPVTDVAGDWAHTSGTFTHNSGTVYLVDDLVASSSDHTITGTTTFHNLKMEQSGQSIPSIQFDHTGTTTIANTATFSLGYRSAISETDRVGIASTSSGNAASVNFQGTVNMFHAALRDINNTGTEFDCTVRCVDNGNNTGVDFSAMSVINVSEISGETTEAGGTATFTVVLMGRPSSNVTIPVTSSDTGEGTSSTATLTFTSSNWYTPQTVTVTGQDDSIDDGTIAYTIQLGSTTSSDSRFSGMDPDDVSVKNRDNDVDDDKIDFENLSDFDIEDVSATSGTDVGAFWDEGYGRITLWENDTTWGDGLDATSTKIMPGCKITLEGVTYDVLQVVNETDYGYDMTLTRDGLSKREVADEIGAYSDYDIDAITCFEAADGGIKLNDNFIQTEGVTSIGESSDIDVDGSSQAFIPASSTTVNIVDLSAATKSTVTVGSNAEGTAYDSSRDVMWISNYNDDTVTAINASDGSYAFGTIGASTFSVGSRPQYMLYDNVNDNIWVSNYLGYTVSVLDALDGSTVATLDTDESWESHKPYDLAYDSVNNSVWVVTGGDALRPNIIEFDAATPGYKAGTLANSRYDYPMVGDTGTKLIYDANELALWLIHDNQGEGPHFLTKIRASDGFVLGAFEVGNYSNDVRIDSSGNIWTANEYYWGEDYDGGYMKLDASTGEAQNFYQAGYSLGSFILDSNDNIWGYDDDTGTFDHWVENGVPYGYYYTMTTNATSQLDVSADGSIESVSMTETLNGQNVYYSVSFDGGNSYKVAGSWLTIASNKASDTSGVDGVWYYLNGEGSYTEATPNDKNAAISKAIAANPVSRMDSSEIEALSSSDWSLSGGFEAGTTTTLDLAATLYTDNANNSPLVKSATFTFGSSSSSSSSSTSTELVSLEEVLIESGASCTVDESVEITLTAKNASQYIVGNDESFIGESWQSFEAGDNLEMSIHWDLDSVDGEKTVFVQFKSETGNLSDIISETIELDSEGECSDSETGDQTDTDEETSETDDTTDQDETGTDIEEGEMIGCMGIDLPSITEAERAEYMFGVSPQTGIASPIDLVVPGAVIRTVSSSTVYCVAQDQTLRPFMDPTIFFTHMRSFDYVRWVKDESISSFEVKDPVLPREGVNLVTYQDSARVYNFELSDDKTNGILHWIVNEVVAAESFGSDWTNFVIDLNKNVQNQFSEGEPIQEGVQADTSNFIPRSELIEGGVR